MRPGQRSSRPAVLVRGCDQRAVATMRQCASERHATGRPDCSDAVQRGCDQGEQHGAMYLPSAPGRQTLPLSAPGWPIR